MAKRLFEAVPNMVANAGIPVAGVPLVEICNGRRVLVENHQGIIAYECREIIVKIRTGSVCICGEGMKISRMNRCQLVISGLISSVSFREIC